MKYEIQDTKMKDEQLCDITKWRTKRRPDRVAKLGKILGELMDGRVSPQQARFGPVVQLWSQLLPVELRQHCRIADISGTRLKVVVDSPPYAHELRLCSEQLLEELQRQCPRAQIKTIKFVVG